MKVVTLFRTEGSIPVRTMIAMATLAGLSSAGVLAVINAAAEIAASDEQSIRYLVLFAIVVALYIISQRYIMTESARHVENILHSIRCRLADKIRLCDLAVFERIGRAEIYASVAKETQLISQSAMLLVIGVQSAILVGFTILYVAWLSKIAFAITLVVTWITLSIYFTRQRENERRLHTVMERENRLLDSFTDIIDGLKEVKMNWGRSSDLHLHVCQLSSSARDLKIDIQQKLANQFIFTQAMTYLLLATLVFLLPKLAPGFSEVVVKSTTAILFILGPMSTIIASIPVMTNANVAAENIEQLESLLGEHQPPATPHGQRIEGFECIEFDAVTFEYSERFGERGFSIGPIDLVLNAGDVVLLSGGNGSGKSTFLKLVGALYQARSGTIRIDGAPLERVDLRDYRNLFSTVFSDYHLFRRLYGFYSVDEVRVRELLEYLEIDDKTGLMNGEFQTLDLSAGQRKRLALAVAMLEDHPIVLLDEWAAEQDPIFRRKFYSEIIPDLQRAGKTIVAVTHDDVADVTHDPDYFRGQRRHIVMEDGRSSA